MDQFEYVFKVRRETIVWTIFDCSWYGRVWCLRTGVFSLQEVGLFICYQPTSAMDSVRSTDIDVLHMMNYICTTYR